MMKEFIDTYKSYIQTYKDQYSNYRWVEALGEIPRFPKLEEWFWRMFLIGWKRITTVEQIAITLKFPSVHDAKPLFEKYNDYLAAGAKALCTVLRNVQTVSIFW